MTRQEASMQIGQRELTNMEIIKLSGGIFFENMGKWLLMSLIIFLPTGFVLQYVMMNLPLEELLAMIESGSLEGISRMDWSPYILYYGLQLGMSLIWILAHLAAAIYADRWLQAERTELKWSQMMLAAVKRWPAGMLVPILMILGILLLCVLLMFGGSIILPMILFFAIFILLWLMLMYYTALTVTAIRPKTGIGAYRYAMGIIRRRAGKTIGLLAILLVLNWAVTYLLELLTSSFYILASIPWLFCLSSALLSVIANLPAVFLALALTIHLINQEQLLQGGSIESRQLPGGFRV